MSAKPKSTNWVIVGVCFLALAAVIAAIFFSIIAMFRSSDVYQQALARVSANAEAGRLLGTPIEPGFPMGSISVSGGSGQAQLSIPVHGPRGKGVIYLEATQRLGAWRFDHLQLKVEGQQEIIDLDPGAGAVRNGRAA